MDALKDMRTQLIIGLVGSVILLVLPLQTAFPVALTLLEAVGVITYAWSVWLLAHNNPLGWWVGLIGVTIYAVIFYQVQLYAEVGIQIFYFVTSLQAIAIWLRGGTQKSEKPVSRVSPQLMGITLVLAIIGLIGLQQLLIAMRGAYPFWDALTTVFSLVAHIYLMWRYVESWYLWIIVDIIYVPLYASRGLYLTSALYVVFLLMAVGGLLNFWRIYREQQGEAKPLVEATA